jgi:hypothetical protein
MQKCISASRTITIGARLMDTTLPILDSGVSHTAVHG